MEYRESNFKKRYDSNFKTLIEVKKIWSSLNLSFFKKEGKIIYIYI